MGFWDVTKRLVMGQPGFEEPQRRNEWDDDAPTADFAEERQQKRDESQGLHDRSGTKRIPEVAAGHTSYHLSGNHVEVRVVFHNTSSRQVELDKMTLCGQKHELDYRLSPGASREFLVYSGPILTHGNYKKAELYYKDSETGDYFCADHSVSYEYESHNSTYNVNSLALLRPIRDV